MRSRTSRTVFVVSAFDAAREQAHGPDFGNATYYAICALTGVLDGPVLIPGTTPPLVPAVRRVIDHLEGWL